MIDAIEQARSRHWQDLADIADKILRGAMKYASDDPIDPFMYVIDDSELESIDPPAGSGLLSHLKAEFTELNG